MSGPSGFPSPDLAVVEAVIRRIPAWTDAPLAIRPLSGGVAMRSYEVTVDERPDRFVVRVPAERTSLLGLARANETEASRRAASLAIGPPVVDDLPGIGTVVTEYVPGRSLTADEVGERLGDVVAVLHRLHASGPLAGAFPVHRMVEWHARDAGAHGVIAPSSYERLHQVSRRIERAFAAAPTPLLPCHNDLRPSKLLDTGTGLLLLDFEHAGMNDVFFELAALSVNVGFGQAGDEQLLRLYLGGITSSAWARLQLMKVMSEFRVGMWAVVQQAVGTSGGDFAFYAEEHLRACERLAASASFEQWLDDARKPPFPQR